MPLIRNSFLIKRFTDFFKLKTTDMLDSEAGRMLVPVITEPIPANIRQVIDTTLNNSDKTITVPSGKQWKILYGLVNFVATATVGSRRVKVILEDDSGNDLYIIEARNSQTASTTEDYSLGQFGDTFESLATQHTLPIPVRAILPENFRIHVLDSTGVDAAADDMTIRFIVEEIDVTGE